MTNQSKMLQSWLKDAHAMEKALIPILENHAKDARDFPQIQARIQQHVEETRNHVALVESCLESLDESPSGTKDVLGSVFGGTQSIATGMYKDELVKNALMDTASEHFEIACYQALIITAEAEGESQIVRICQQILQEEQSMALWLEQQLPTVVRTSMQMERS